MQFKKVAAALGACVAIASGLVVGGNAVATAAPGCPSLYVVAIPGTWETGHDKKPQPGMLSGVTNGLGPETKVDYVTYAATAFPWEGDVYGQSKREATDKARGLVGAMAQRCGATKIGLVGYSQGADAAGDLAAEIGTGVGVVPPSRIAGVGLISDPRRSPNDIQVGPHAGGAGGGGPRVGGFGWIHDRVRTICAVDDLYCATASDDFVTRFAGFLAQSSDANPANMWRYQLEAGAIINDLMAHGGIPTLQSQLTESANQQRIKELEEFYGSHAHTKYGSYQVGGGQTAISWMHNWFARMA
ncbi:cutinase family protein [Nocardia cyriacigeorgica]|uniref:cutinase family protein n=1 Tax=Nocardia cyriacigeorgica TaxID=135487 RepID=UPI0018960D47|nr:cutinase family protein [Nocardia cyriacigeorgica]MBF6413104.1 cutinase family protein [Nocardia cyriacigeorgica]